MFISALMLTGCGFSLSHSTKEEVAQLNNLSHTCCLIVGEIRDIPIGQCFRLAYLANQKYPALGNTPQEDSCTLKNVKVNDALVNTVNTQATWCCYWCSEIRHGAYFSPGW